MRDSVSLFHRIEKAMETIALGSTALETIGQTATFLVAHFAKDLGIRGGRIYAQDDGSFELVSTFGNVSKAPIGLRVWRSYPPMEQLLDVGSLVMRRDDARLDQRLEEDLGVGEWFAAVAVADGRYVLTFDVRADTESHEELLATLNIVRLAINQKLREERVMEIIEEARLIQASILPRHLPRPGDFEIAARSLAAEIVGGDFYDVIELDETSFDVVLADATGHGLPAALQVRDVFTGLRMGLSREFKISRTVERLNGIIHRSRLATRFVSLVLAELSTVSSTVFYCNAGHPGPILMRPSGSVERLETNGIILGPVADAAYTVGINRMDPGDLLLLFSDGITEARDPETDEEYGTDRLIAVMRRHRHLDAGPLMDKVFRDVAEFTRVGTPADDQTVVVVKRRPSQPDEEPA